jgi:septation ring formation regulator EzrA
MFEGLTRDQAEQLADRLRQATAASIAKNDLNGLQDALEDTYTAFKQEVGGQSQVATATDLDARENSAAARLNQLYKFPSGNRAEIRQLEGQMDEISRQRQQAGQAQRAADGNTQRAARLPELEQKVSALTAEYQQKQTRPSIHRARLAEIDKELTSAMSEIDELRLI